MSDQADGGLRLGPIGQIARHVSNTAASEVWYRDVLRLPHLFTYGDLAFFDCGGVRLLLSQGEGESATGGMVEPSILYFRVPDIQGAHDELAERGVTFDGAPHRIFTHPDGTEEWIAFFNDPDGHLLALMSQVPGDPHE
jgi:catechol 2,3-dioxygenase-like lactoylglutathione lyase family enzyme